MPILHSHHSHLDRLLPQPFAINWSTEKNSEPRKSLVINGAIDKKEKAGIKVESRGKVSYKETMSADGGVQ